MNMRHEQGLCWGCLLLQHNLDSPDWYMQTPVACRVPVECCESVRFLTLTVIINNIEYCLTTMCHE